MSTNLVELTASIVSSHASGSEMSREDLLQEINQVFTALKSLESGNTEAEVAAVAAPVMSLKKAFQNDQVCCMICGKTGFKTLTRHLKQAHDMKPRQYRKDFNIPQSQALTAKNYSEARRQAAKDNNLADNLEKARAARGKNQKVATTVKAAKPVKATKAAKATKPAAKKKA